MPQTYHNGPMEPRPDAAMICTCRVELEGWRLHVAHLARREDRDLGNVMELALKGAAARLRHGGSGAESGPNPAARRLRESLARLGQDPERTPPSSESMIAEYRASEDPARGSLAWRFLFLLVAKSQAPWSVMDREELSLPLVFRRGRPGERIPDRGADLDAEGLPVLADREGVRASPWTLPSPSELEGCREPVFVCYLPGDLFRRVNPRGHMGRAIWFTWAYKFITERTCAPGASEA